MFKNLIAIFLLMSSILCAQQGCTQVLFTQGNSLTPTTPGQIDFVFAGVPGLSFIPNIADIPANISQLPPSTEREAGIWSGFGVTNANSPDFSVSSIDGYTNNLLSISLNVQEEALHNLSAQMGSEYSVDNGCVYAAVIIVPANPAVYTLKLTSLGWLIATHPHPSTGPEPQVVMPVCQFEVRPQHPVSSIIPIWSGHFGPETFFSHAGRAALVQARFAGDNIFDIFSGGTYALQVVYFIPSGPDPLADDYFCYAALPILKTLP